MTRRTKLLAIAAAGAALLAAVWWMIVEPARAEPVLIRGKIRQAQKSLDGQKQWLGKREAIESAWEAHRAKVAAKDLNEVARTFGQDISKMFENAKIDPGRSGEQHQEKSGVFTEIGSTANFRCDQNRFAALLRELDSFAGYLRVNTMTVNSHFDEAKNDLDVNVKVSTPWYGGESSKGGR